MIRLPEEFKKRMKTLLGEEEYALFLKSYEKEPRQALRVNTNKISIEDFLRISPFTLQAVPWAPEGFYYGKMDRPGRHPYHEAGLYYIQEPSAMSVAVLADPQPGERVLDLCAAPGGKTTQMAARMKGQGLLVSNEIHPARAKVLSQNVERMGISNALVTNESSSALSRRFPAFFDKVVVDAPCSGEGMFRKEEQALLQWSPDNVQMCAERQDEILEEAAKMLRPGGRLVYSTCTFAPEEDEGTVSRFLESHKDFEVEKMPACERFAPGRPDWARGMPQIEYTLRAPHYGHPSDSYLRYTCRLWPHRLDGEGHYAAVLRKDKPEPEGGGRFFDGSRPSKKEAFPEAYKEFVACHLARTLEGTPVLFGEQLYLLPYPAALDGLKVLRAGLHLGSVRKGRFEPSHGLALALQAEDAVRRCLLSGEGAVQAYLRGESLPFEGEKGWYLVLVDGYSLGWGKVSNGMLKNHYPKGLRRA